MAFDTLWIMASMLAVFNITEPVGPNARQLSRRWDIFPTLGCELHSTSTYPIYSFISQKGPFAIQVFSQAEIKGGCRPHSCRTSLIQIPIGCLSLGLVIIHCVLLVMSLPLWNQSTMVDFSLILTTWHPDQDPGTRVAPDARARSFSHSGHATASRLCRQKILSTSYERVKERC